MPPRNATSIRSRSHQWCLEVRTFSAAAEAKMTTPLPTFRPRIDFPKRFSSSLSGTFSNPLPPLISRFPFLFLFLLIFPRECRRYIPIKNFLFFFCRTPVTKLANPTLTSSMGRRHDGTVEDKNRRISGLSLKRTPVEALRKEKEKNCERERAIERASEREWESDREKERNSVNRKETRNEGELHAREYITAGSRQVPDQYGVSAGGSETVI